MSYAHFSFDLSAPHPYYTRAMRTDWSRQVPVDTLVGDARPVEFEIPLRDLPRIEPSLAVREGHAKGSIRVARELGLAIADIQLEAQPQVVCQRCMQALEWPVVSRSRLALVPDLAAADRVPEGVESYVTEHDRVSIRELVEEEILLALPSVPKCAAGDACSRMLAVTDQLVGSQASAEEGAARVVQTPFAQLRELLKKD